MAKPSGAFITFGVINIVFALIPPLAGCLGASFYTIRENEPLVVRGRDVRPQFNQHLEREAPTAKAEAITATAANSCIGLLLIVGAIGLFLGHEWGRWLSLASGIFMVLAFCVHDVYSFAILRPAVERFFDQRLPGGPEADGFKFGFSLGFIAWSCFNPVLMMYIVVMCVCLGLAQATSGARRRRRSTRRDRFDDDDYLRD